MYGWAAPAVFVDNWETLLDESNVSLEESVHFSSLKRCHIVKQVLSI